MRRPLAAVAVAVLILAAVTVAGFEIAACGGSSDSAANTQAAAPSAPGGGQAPDMSALFTKALDPLVEDGTITSDQESTVIDALASSTPSGGAGQGGQMPSPGATPPSGSQGSPPDPGQMFSTALDPLVSDGTITSAQEKAITEALSSAMQQSGPGGQQGVTQTGAANSAGTTSSTQTY